MRSMLKLMTGLLAKCFRRRRRELVVAGHPVEADERVPAGMFAFKDKDGRLRLLEDWPAGPLVDNLRAENMKLRSELASARACDLGEFQRQRQSMAAAMQAQRHGPTFAERMQAQQSLPPRYSQADAAAMMGFGDQLMGFRGEGNQGLGGVLGGGRYA